MLDFRRVVKNRKIQPEAAFCPTKSLGLEWMNSNPRMQIANLFLSILHWWWVAFIFIMVIQQINRGPTANDNRRHELCEEKPWPTKSV